MLGLDPPEMEFEPNYILMIYSNKTLLTEHSAIHAPEKAPTFRKQIKTQSEHEIFRGRKTMAMNNGLRSCASKLITAADSFLPKTGQSSLSLCYF